MTQQFDPTLSSIGVATTVEHEINVEDILPKLVGSNGSITTVPVEEIADLLEDVDAVAVEPTEPEEIPEGDVAIETAAARPVLRKISGRYRSRPATWRLELRVDVDGRRPMRRISGDYYRASGRTVSYFGSFVINSLTVRATPTHIVLEGVASTTWNASYRKARVTIRRNNTTQPPGQAHIQWMSLTNRPGSAYTCFFESTYFRTVQYEQDYVGGTTPFRIYDTGSLPSGGPARPMSVQGAYAEAGVQMQTAGTWNPIPIAGAGPNSRWSNAELHGAMERQFSLWRDVPQWKVWMLAAQLHENGPGLLGIMFDQKGRQRQGCAVFHNTSLGGTTPEKLRLQLYAYVHELGHCFNLFHSFHKRYMTPPMPNRLSALSWMNYPGRFPGGENAFWSGFPFQFDPLELIHLRHAFRNNIIIGGNAFGIGAALEDQQAFADPVEDDSGLILELEPTKSNFAFGEPVVVEINLRLADLRGKTVHTQLHPNMGSIQVGIRKPNGQVVVYQPMVEQCMEVQTTRLDAETPAIYESAYIGHGKDGFYFDQVGTYQLRAAYFDLDGSEIVSNVLTLRVGAPRSIADEEIADLFFGEDQGNLFALLGSDSEFLKGGNDAFDLMLDKYGEHPMAVYPRLVQGINESREFKTLDVSRPDKLVTARKPHLGTSKELLSAVVDATERGAGVDNITLSMTTRRLAAVQKADGDDQGAQETLSHMVTAFGKKGLKPHVQRGIEQMAQEPLDQLITEEEPA